MKMWKKLMVFAVALLLISAIMAAQFVSVSVDEVRLDVDTQHADLQLIAGDECVVEDGENMLKYVEEEGFQLELGTWGEQNEFMASAAFGIVNAGAVAYEITNVYVEDEHEGGFDDAVDMYFHWDTHERLDGQELDEISLTHGDNGVDPAVTLGAGEGYDGDTSLNITGDNQDPATWDAEENVWVADSGQEFDEGENAVWIYVHVDPDVEETWDDGDLSLRFDVEEVEG